MDPRRPSTPSPSGYFSRCLEICSTDGQYTEDIVAEGDHGRTRPPTGYAQLSSDGVLPQYALSVLAQYDTLQGTQQVILPGGHDFNLDDHLYPPSQEDLDVFPSHLDDVLVDYPLLPLSGHPSTSLDSHEKCAYRSPIQHARYDGDSFFQYLDSESAALQYLSSSSPPPSSSPLPQSSSPPSDDCWLSSCLAPHVLEEECLTKPTKAPLSGSTPDLSPDSLDSSASYHSSSSTFEKHSSKSSFTSQSSRSVSSSRSRSDSPDGAHTNTDYDFDSTYERDDGFTDRLHQLLLVVVRERELELEQGPERVVECDADCFCQSIPYAYRHSASAYTDTTSSPCVSRSYELSPLKIGTLASITKIIEDASDRYALSPSLCATDNCSLRSATFTASSTLYSPSAMLSPLDRSPLPHEEYQRDSVIPDSDIDTLVFASPSCSPPARTLKRPRSLSNDQTNIDHLSFQRKLRKTGYSVFSSSTDSNNTPTPKTTTIDQVPVAQYRIIKTPSTFLAERKLKYNHQHRTQLDDRPSKIPRIKSNHDTSSAFRNFATGSASLRRAASLRSNAESEPDEDDENRTPTFDADSNLVPTVPTTPHTLTHASRARDHDHKRRALARQILRAQSSPVPIIAPPKDHMPRLPLSEEANAKIRLERLLERERRAREVDGLGDVALGVGIGRNVKSEEGRASEGCDDEDTDDDGDHNRDGGVLRAPDDWEVGLGVGEDLRREVIQWILEVVPVYTTSSRASSCSSRSSSCSSSCSSSSSRSGFSSSRSASTSTSTSAASSPSTSPDRNIKTQYNLLDQLSTSPETRFHAAYMFLRYFYLVFRSSPYDDPEAKVERHFQCQKAEERAAPGNKWVNDKAVDGWDLVTWDVGVACLALSVKFHRDFLNPLLPVYAYEYQGLAPHYMSYEDLETSQRDILSAFSYSLGSTPQAVLDELWIALPSLRQLFDYHGGRSCMTKETWRRLFEAVLEPDVLRFPISLLTAASLVDAIHVCLARKYEYQARWNAEMARRRRPGRRGYDLKQVAGVQAKREGRAQWEAEGVVQDIQAVLRISDARLRECRCWLGEVILS